MAVTVGVSVLHSASGSGEVYEPLRNSRQLIPVAA
jgi:hypothetical protein